MPTPDEKFMKQALRLASMADPSPNPKVGAVIAKGGRILAGGFHRKAGLPHAEIEALRNLKPGQAKGSTLYVTLEPCSHWGRTPPCTREIIKAGLSGVVYAMDDPTEKVCGKEELEKAGIDVKSGILKTEAENLNPSFSRLARTGMPFVSLKTAMSLDGKIATRTGNSKWISGQESLKFAHLLRSRNEAVLAGIGTILKDNPRLTTRLVKGESPIKVILDARLRIPLSSKALSGGQAIIAASSNCNKEKKKKLEKLGAKVLIFPGRKIPPKKLLLSLGKMGVSSLLIEGGGETNAGFVSEGLVDRFYFAICPKIIGGRDAKTPVEGKGVPFVSQALPLEFEKVERLGEDVLITAVPKGKK